MRCSNSRIHERIQLRNIIKMLATMPDELYSHIFKMNASQASEMRERLLHDIMRAGYYDSSKLHAIQASEGYFGLCNQDKIKWQISIDKSISRQHKKLKK